MTRHIKIPKIHFSTFWIHPTPVTALPQPGERQTHLDVPREYLFRPKLKIHVKIIYCEVESQGYRTGLKSSGSGPNRTGPGPDRGPWSGFGPILNKIAISWKRLVRFG